MAGIYIHIPFCRQLCNYCNFYFSLSEERKEQMADAIIKEMELRKDFLPYGSLETLYIGGGTPSLYPPEVLGRFVSKIAELWGINSFKEFTIEVNPDDITEEYLEGLRAIGCNRLSIGIQSFNDDILCFMNRRHSSAEAFKAVELARLAGFENITIDLIYGVPNQTLEMLKSDLETAKSLNPQHISAYHLTIEKGSIFAKMEERGEIKSVDESVSEEHYAFVDETLRRYGYNHYEVSNFAKPGFEAIHNGNYWKLKPYLGVGPSAHSFDGESNRSWNFASNPRYLRAIEGNEPFFESETLTLFDKVNEYLMVSLRTSSGIDFEYIKEHFGSEILNYIMQQSATFLTSGDVIKKSNGLAIKPESFLKSDFIISELFCCNPLK